MFPHPHPTHHTAWVSSTIAIHRLCGGEGGLCFLFRNWLLFFFIQTKWVLKILPYYACVCLRLDICYDCWLFIALGSRDCVTIRSARRSLRCVQIILHHNFTVWSKPTSHWSPGQTQPCKGGGARLVGIWLNTLIVPWASFSLDTQPGRRNCI